MTAMFDMIKCELPLFITVYINLRTVGVYVLLIVKYIITPLM